MRKLLAIAGICCASASNAQVQTFDVRYAGDWVAGVDNAPITNVWLTANGRYVAFRTARSDLRPNDIPMTTEAYASYLPLQRPIWLSKPTDKGPVSIGAGETRISEDGRIAAWEQAADNSGREAGVFIRDRDLDTTMLASIDAVGAHIFNPRLQGLSADGRYSLITSLNDLWRFDRVSGTSARIATSPPILYSAKISPTGNATAWSNANGVWLASPTGTVQIIDAPGASARVLAVSDSGDSVIFYTAAPLSPTDIDSLGDLYHWTPSGLRLIDMFETGANVNPTVSANLRWAAYTTNRAASQLVRIDLFSGEIAYGPAAHRLDQVKSIDDDGRVVALDPFLPGPSLVQYPMGTGASLVVGSGTAPKPSSGGVWSRNGRFVVWMDGGNSTVRVRDIDAGRSTEVPQATGWNPVAASDNGRYLLFQQPGFTRWIDRKSGAVRTIGTLGTADLSPNGGYIAANGLIGGRPNLQLIVAETGATRSIARKIDGAPSTQAEGKPYFVTDGSRVLFSTTATDLSCGFQRHPDPDMPSYSLLEYRLDSRALSLVRIGIDAKDGIEGIASDATGRRIAILQGDANADYFITVVYLDRSTGMQRTLPGSFPQYRGLSMTPDGAYLATVGTGSNEETPIFHRLATGQFGTGFPIRGGSGNATGLRLFDGTRTLRCFLDGYPMSFRFEFPPSP